MFTHRHNGSSRLFDRDKNANICIVNVCVCVIASQSIQIVKKRNCFPFSGNRRFEETHTHTQPPICEMKMKRNFVVCINEHKYQAKQDQIYVVEPMELCIILIGFCHAPHNDTNHMMNNRITNLKQLIDSDFCINRVHNGNYLNTSTIQTVFDKIYPPLKANRYNSMKSESKSMADRQYDYRIFFINNNHNSGFVFYAICLLFWINIEPVNEPVNVHSIETKVGITIYETEQTNEWIRNRQ